MIRSTPPSRSPQALAASAALVLLTFSSSGLHAQVERWDSRNVGQPVAVQAQQGMPRITAFDVKAVDRIEPGAELEFTLWGTPGSEATLAIDGAQRSLRLVEGAAGVYQGVYTVTRRDRIPEDARVVANLRRGNQVGTATLDESLVEGRGVATTGGATQDGNLQVQRVVVVSGDRRAGSQGSSSVVVTAYGTPGARATAILPGQSPRRLPMLEVKPGEYTAGYNIQPNDRFDLTQPVSVRMRLGDRVVIGRSEQSLDGVVRSQAAVLPAVDQARAGGWSQIDTCPSCATVQAIQRVATDGDGAVLGTVGGAVIGGLLGNQVGGGDGRKAATVAGAIGGAVLGRKLQKDRQHDKYEVVLRLNASGGRETVIYDEAPPFKVGDAVRLESGRLVANPAR